MNAVPLASSVKKILSITYASESDLLASRIFNQELRGKGYRVVTMSADARSTQAELDAIKAQADSADVIIASAYVFPRESQGTIGTQGGFSALVEQLAVAKEESDRDLVRQSVSGERISLGAGLHARVGLSTGVAASRCCCAARTEADLRQASDFDSARLQGRRRHRPRSEGGTMTAPAVRLSLVVAGVTVMAACAAQASRMPVPVRIAAVPTVVSAAPSSVGMSDGLTATLDSIMRSGIAGGAAPGGALAVGRYGRVVFMKGYGRQDTAKASAAVDENTMYDMASLTKVISTTTAAMMLEEQGLLNLDRTVASYLPEFNAPDKAPITIRMIVTHRGGLEAFAALYKQFKGREEYLTQINARPLKSVPGTETVYSDWDMILTQLVIERITGQTLDRFVADRIFTPLGMSSTMYIPDSAKFFDAHRADRDRHGARRTRARQGAR